MSNQTIPPPPTPLTQQEKQEMTALTEVISEYSDLELFLLESQENVRIFKRLRSLNMKNFVYMDFVMSFFSPN